MRNLLVTGGAGFMGSNFIAHVLGSTENLRVFNLDCLTYAGDTRRLSAFEDDRRYTLLRADIRDRDAVDGVFALGIDLVVHFAAETHVDRSITDPSPFLSTNVLGTAVLMDAALRRGVTRFIHVSTDEVYGELGDAGTFSEGLPLRPGNPYSVSKAAADLFVAAYQRTYGLEVTIVRPSNNYGPWQFPEKLIPVAISRALDDRPIPVYAGGMNVREWLYVEDCARGVLDVLDRGGPGEIYNLGSGHERRNIDVVRAVLSLLGKPESLVEYVEDRPGHDFRYSMDSAKVRSETAWAARVSFEEGIERTVRWYVDNQPWWRAHLA